MIMIMISGCASQNLDTLFPIGHEKMEKDGRSILVVRPYDWYEFFSPEELQEMSRPEYMDEVEAIVKAKR
jgi:hypothetical protein